MAEGQKRFPLSTITTVIVISLLLAGGISYVIASKIAGERTVVNRHEPGVLYRIGDKDGLIINVGGPNSGRYLKIGLVLELRPKAVVNTSVGHDKKEKAVLSHEEIKIQDAVVQLLRSMRIEDFDATRQDQLKERIRAEVNRSLGENRVLEVYITSFVLQ